MCVCITNFQSVNIFFNYISIYLTDKSKVFIMADKPEHSVVSSDVPVESNPVDVPEDVQGDDRPMEYQPRGGPEEYKAAGTGAEVDELCAIVIDCGSEMSRAGFAGDDIPRCEFPTIVGRKQQVNAGGFRVRGANKIHVGDYASSIRGIDVSCPINHGVVTNWDDMEQIWHYIFIEELNVSPKDRQILLTEPSLNPKINREKMVQIMFETFRPSGVYIENQGKLSLFCSGRTTGLTLDSGFGLTQVVPVIDGYVFPDGIVTSDLAGYNLTQHMIKMLAQLGGFSPSSNDLKADADELKKKHCYVAQNFDQELRGMLEKPCDLPEGKLIDSIKLGSERIKCPEGLFKPDIMGAVGSSIQEMVYQSISKCDIESQASLYSNIVMAGGSTMFPGFKDRLTKEVKALAAPGTNVQVIAPPERKYSCWIGGAILASLKTFGHMWITKEQYDETGPNIVHLKCI